MSVSEISIDQESTAASEELLQIANRRSTARLSRRAFVASVGAVGAAGSLALTGCSDDGAVTTVAPAGATTPGVADVLNFALNLEYLEASFYLYVTTGSGLPSADMGAGAGTVTGGAKVSFVNPVVANVAAQLANDEKLHVEFLRNTISGIGASPVSMPSINLAALGAVTSDATFLALARQLEAVGISAYAGSAQYLVSNTAAVTYAAQILHTESQHGAFLRQLCLALSVTSPAVDALDIPPTASAIFNTSPTTGLVATRTTSQVLGIAFGVSTATTTTPAAGTTKGGFFPNGISGLIAST